MPKARDGRSGRFVFNGGDSPESRNTELNPLYNTWKELVSRCTNPRHHSYKYYGGAGISLHEPWLSYEAFRSDILATIGSPQRGLVLGRIEISKGYEPGNVKWTSLGEQTRKRRGVKLDAHKVRAIRALDGTMTQVEIAEHFGIHQTAISRVLSGQRWANVS